jgi:hypothetical protein
MDHDLLYNGGVNYGAKKIPTACVLRLCLLWAKNEYIVGPLVLNKVYNYIPGAEVTVLNH